MGRKSKRSILVATVLAVLLLLVIILPLILGAAQAEWEPTPPSAEPGYNSRYHENVYSAEDAADSGYYHGIPVIKSMSMTVSEDGNVKLGVNARYRLKLIYNWQAWSNLNGVDGWMNVEEATEETFRPADFLKSGNHMVRLALTHAGSGSIVSKPIIISVEDGAGDNPGFTGSMSDLLKSAWRGGYYSATFVTESGLVDQALEG